MITIFSAILYPIKLLIEILIYLTKLLLIDMVYIYKFTISPLLPKTCRFYPTCSTYMILAISEWGVFRGVMLGLKRIFRCRPGGRSGEDFVPINIKGDLKWIY